MSVNKKLNEKRITNPNRGERRLVRSLTVPNRLNKLPMVISAEDAKKLKKVVGSRFYYHPPVNSYTRGSLYDVKTRKHVGKVTKYPDYYSISAKFSNGSKPVSSVNLTEKEFFTSGRSNNNDLNNAARKIQKLFMNKTEVMKNKIMNNMVNKNFYIQWSAGGKSHRHQPDTFVKLLNSQMPGSVSSLDNLLLVLNNKNMRKSGVTFKDPYTRLRIPLSSVKVMVNGKNRMTMFRNDNKKEVEKLAKEMNVNPDMAVFLTSEIFDFMRLFPVMSRITKKTGDTRGIVGLLREIYSTPQYLNRMEPNKIIASGERMYKRLMEWNKTRDYKKLVSELKRTNGMLDDMRFNA